MLGKNYKKPIEKLVYRPEKDTAGEKALSPDQLVRHIIARRAALEFKDGMYGECW